MDLLSNSKVVQDFYKVVHTFYPKVEDYTKCVKELSSFRLKEGLFANPLVQGIAKEQPTCKWWMMNGGENHSFLQNIATKFIFQCAANLSS